MKNLFTILLIILIPFNFLAVANAKQFKKNIQSQDYKIQYLNLSWWERYNDPILTGYLQELYDRNNDLKIAALKVKEGEKVVKISFANELPHLSFDGNFGRNMASSNQQFGNMLIPSFSQYEFQMPLTASYEIDIWGENRLKTKSIQKELEIIKQDERASYIALTSAFSADYFNLIKTDKLIQLQEEIVNTQKIIVDKTEIKYKNGLCTVNEVINEKKILTSQKEILNNLISMQSVLNNQLKVYLSDNDKDIKRIPYENLSILGNIPQKFDSNIVENRPDYIRAEEYIKKIGYDVRIAKKEFLPKFFIYGQIGFNAYQWSKLFSSYSQLANAGIMPVLDLFSGGRKIAVLNYKKYEFDEAIQKYQKAVLIGFQEINDAALMVAVEEKNYKESLERLTLENQKYTLISHKNEIGAASNLEVLYNKENNLLVQKDEVSNKINFLISTIGLYKAVGGQDLYSISNEDVKL